MTTSRSEGNFPLLENLEKLLNNQDVYQEVYFVLPVLCTSFCFRSLVHMLEMMTLLGISVMLLYIALIHCILVGMNPLSFNLLSTMMRLKLPTRLDPTRGSIN